jgi:hypothetical protein
MKIANLYLYSESQQILSGEMAAWATADANDGRTFLRDRHENAVDSQQGGLSSQVARVREDNC